MLRVHYSNKPSALLAQFSGHLVERGLLPPRDVFAELPLVVGSRPLEAWVKQALAPRAGIVANFRTWLLRRWVGQLVSQAFPGGRPLDGDAIRDRLLARFLDGGLDGRHLGPVRSYLARGEGDAHELRHLQLAAQLSVVFEEYLFSRFEMLDAWSKGRPSVWDGGGEQAAWQRALWQDVMKDETLIAPSRLLEVAPAKLSPRGAPLFVFGLSSFGVLFHRLLAHVAQSADVSLYTLNPCAEFWEDLESIRERRARGKRRAALLSPEDLDTEDPFGLRGDPCRPLVLWGRPAREAVSLLNQATDGDAEGAFVDPGADSPTLLRALQSDILRRQGPDTPTPGRFAGDTSLEVLEAPSLRRECEAVAARIWALLDADRSTPPLRLDDVAVLIAGKDAERYVPALLTAFRENHGLPSQLVGLPFALTSPVIEAALLLLELPQSRFTRADVLRVLTHPVVAARCHGASPDDWVRWVDSAGIVHGLDHGAHEGTYIDRDVLNWDQGLRRVALGAFLATRADGGEALLELGGERYLPDPAGRHLEAGAGALVLLARSLLEDARALRGAELSASEWAAVLERLFVTYLVPGDDFERRALDAALRVVRGLRDRDLGGRTLSYLVATELVREQLGASGTSSGGAVTGGVRLSTLSASRGIPARVQFIVGLGEGAFPSADRAEALDLRAVKRRAGDASGREKDESLFLEALLSTDDRLILSSVARDERSGEARSPSPVVAGLLQLLDTGYLGRALDDASAHPLKVSVPLWRADAGEAADVRFAPSRAAVEERALRTAGAALRAVIGPALPGESARNLVRGLSPAVRATVGAALRLVEPPGDPPGPVSSRSPQTPPPDSTPGAAPLRSPRAERSPSASLGTGSVEGPPPDETPRSPASTALEAEEVVRVSLSDLRRYLECPLQGSARVRLGLRDGEDEDDLVERRGEVFGSPALVTVPLLRQSFVEAWRTSGGQALPKDDTAASSAFDDGSETLVAQGRFPVGLFLAGERAAGAEVLAGWRAQLLQQAPPGGAPLEVVRFGPASEQEDAECVLPALVVHLELPADRGPGGAPRGEPGAAGAKFEPSGPPGESPHHPVVGDRALRSPPSGAPAPRRVRVEVVGATQPLWGRGCSLLLQRSKPKTSPGDRFQALLKVWPDLVVLAAAGRAEPAGHRVLVCTPTRCTEERLAPLGQEEARAYLEAVLADLLGGDNDLLFPIEAVPPAFLSLAPTPFPAVVRALLRDTRADPCAGAVRSPERFRVPGGDEARHLFERRLAPLSQRWETGSQGGRPSTALVPGHAEGLEVKRGSSSRGAAGAPGTLAVDGGGASPGVGGQTDSSAKPAEGPPPPAPRRPSKKAPKKGPPS